MRAGLWVGVGLIALVVVAGCGGSSSPSSPSANGVGGLHGNLAGVTQPQEYALYLDGAPLAVAPAPDGSFTVPGVPAGQHTLALVSASGDDAKYLTVEVTDGGTVEMGEITPEPAGEITGQVMKKSADGALTPVAGAEVLADPNVYVIMSEPAPGDGSTTGGETRPTIYPPPPHDPGMVQCRAITDEAGNYTIPGVPPGDYVVSVNVPGLIQGTQYVTVTAGAPATANFELQEAVDPGVGTIQGTVTAKQTDGTVTLVEGALVSVTVATPWEPPMSTEPLPAPPDAVARHPMAAQEGGTVDGGAPIIMAPPYEFRVFETLTDKDGHYSLNVPAGAVNLSVWAEGYAPSWQELSVGKDATAVANVALEPWTPVEPPVPGPEPKPEPGPDGG